MLKKKDISVSLAVERIELSASNKASESVRELKRQGVDVINLTVGVPDFDTPDYIKDAAYSAMLNGETKYTSIHGTDVLKKAVIQKFQKDHNRNYDADEIAVSAGAKQIIFNAFMATLNPGDEVILPKPSYISYSAAVQLIGGSVIEVPTSENNFHLPLDKIESLITSKTKWIIINSPNNPTGAVYNKEELEGLADILRKNSHVMVLSDDVYEHLTFDKCEFLSLVQIAPDIAGQILSVNSVSKTYAMTGWRIGYAAGPKQLIRAMAKVQSQSTAAPCSVSQAAAVAALNGSHEIINERLKVMQGRRDFIVNALSRIPNLSVNIPDGTFFILLNFAELVGRKTKKGKTIITGEDFAEYLLNSSLVATIPGEAYGLQNHVRISFAIDIDLLQVACDRIREACSQLQ